MKKVLVALSGGVDSSMTAYTLQAQGYDVTGIYMKLHGNEESHQKNLANIEKVSQFLSIPYHVLDLSAMFGEKIYNYFVQGYSQGLTPNPCSFCNKLIKFGALFEYMQTHNFDYLATGHYAQTDGEYVYEAQDMSKDQSYFLALIEPQNLKKILFPLGNQYKIDIKAQALAIPEIASLATQKESSEICFVEKTYLDVLKLHFPIESPGDVLDNEGKTIGMHQGFMHYTIGQRKGFRVASPIALYVNEIDAEHNTIRVGTKENLATFSFSIHDYVGLKESGKASVKIRYRSLKTPCFYRVNGEHVDVILDEAVYGVAKGQVAVFYENNKVIGGGIIA